MPKDSKPPFFPFYVDDFASDGKVEAMTTEEVGAYILLLCKAWREEPVGSLPADDRVLARWSRLTSDVWSVCKLAVLAPFELRADGRLYQKRMEKEFRKLRDYRRTKSKAGKAGAEARWEKEKGDGKRMADALRSHSDRIDLPVAKNGSSPSSSSSDLKPKAGVLTNLKAADLRDTAKLVDVWTQLADGPYEIPKTEAGQLIVIAASERAMDRGTHKAALFRSLLISTDPPKRLEMIEPYVQAASRRLAAWKGAGAEPSSPAQLIADTLGRKDATAGNG